MNPLRRAARSVLRLIGKARRLLPGARPDEAEEELEGPAERVDRSARPPRAVRPGRPAGAGVPAARPLPAFGVLHDRMFGSGSDARRYQVYVPAKALVAPRPVPVVVMLHGCKQTAPDFSRGTRMNAQADRHGFIVVWPEQSLQANEHGCWNWFVQGNQRRDAGEPALIIGIVAEVIAMHRVDSSRVFVAGLSAGASLAVTLARVYPDLFAGLGAHSGVAYRAAHEPMSALGVMKRGPSSLWGAVAQTRRALGLHQSGAPNWLPVPTIVLHGNRDAIVHVSNGRAIADEAAALYGDTIDPPQATEWPAGEDRYAVTRVSWARGSGPPAVEFWLYEGLGHAWAGGDPTGSFTDPLGPDATEAIVAFFVHQPRERSRARAWLVRARRSRMALAAS